MRLFVTIASAAPDTPALAPDSASGPRRDLVLQAAGRTTVAALAGRLGGAENPGGPPATLFLGERELPADLPLSEAGIRDGVTLGLGGPVPPGPDSGYGPDRSELPPPSRSADGERLPRGPRVELQLIGGRGAGRSWPLDLGTRTVGPAAGSSVRLQGRGVPDEGICLTVRPDGTVLLETGKTTGAGNTEGTEGADAVAGVTPATHAAGAPPAVRRATAPTVSPCRSPRHRSAGHARTPRRCRPPRRPSCPTRTPIRTHRCRTVGRNGPWAANCGSVNSCCGWPSRPRRTPWWAYRTTAAVWTSTGRPGSSRPWCPSGSRCPRRLSRPPSEAFRCSWCWHRWSWASAWSSSSTRTST